MSQEACLCAKCSNEKFNSLECMFCSGRIPAEGGKLRSVNGARVCVGCIKKAFKVLEKVIKQEAMGSH